MLLFEAAQSVAMVLDHRQALPAGIALLPSSILSKGFFSDLLWPSPAQAFERCPGHPDCGGSSLVQGLSPALV